MQRIRIKLNLYKPIKTNTMKDTIKILREIADSDSPSRELYSLHPYDVQDIEDLMYLANKIHSKIYK